MKKIIAILVLVVVSYCSISQTNLQEIYEKFNFKYNDNVIGLSVSATNCTNFTPYISKLEKIAKQNNLKLFYLISDVREKEISHYFKSKLRLESKSRRIIASNESIQNLIGENTGRPIIIEFVGGAKTNSYDLMSFVSKFSQNNSLNQLDSTLIEKDSIVIYSKSQLSQFTDSVIIIADNFYNNLYQYNLYENKIINEFTFSESDIEHYFYSKISNRERLWNNRKEVKQNDPIELNQEIEYGKIKTFGNRIYLSVRLRVFTSIEDGYYETTMVNFIVEMNSSLKLVRSISVYPIEEYKCFVNIVDISSSFLFLDSTSFIARLTCQDQINGGYPLFARYKIVDDKAQFDSFTNLNLPSYYMQNKLGYNYLMHSTFLKDNIGYFILDILPKIYNFLGNEVFTLENVNFETTRIELGARDNKVGFMFLSNSIYIEKKDLTIHILSHENFDSEISYHKISTDWQEIERKKLNLKPNRGSFLIVKDFVYFLDNGKDDQLYLYKYNLKL